jgi:hypothetical protein
MGDESPTDRVGGPAKRPYVTPAIEWEEEMDVRATLASACLKIDTDMSCEASTAS